MEFFFQAEPDIPAARNAIQNALTRLPFHRTWWYNDPDCLLLRPTTDLTLDEVQSLAAVIALGDGALLLSDDMQAVPEKRLQIARVLLPPVGKAGRILDWFDSATPSRLRLDLENESGRWHLLGIFNWQDEPQDMKLSLPDFGLDALNGKILARDFWRGKFIPISDGRVQFKAIPPHGCLLLAVRHIETDQPNYLGGDLHISQGQEVSVWKWDSTSASLDFALERPGHSRGQIDLYLPKEPVSLMVDDQEVNWDRTGEGIYRIDLDFQERAVLELKF
jgi:alpha-galactosidase